jgi:predicted sulfurtransferase
MKETQKPCDALAGVPLWDIPADQRSAVLRARERLRALERQKAWNTAHGRVELSDGTKSYTGTCQECRKPFTVERSAASGRKWPSVCDGCQDYRRRKQTAARVRKHREARRELGM